MNVIRKLMKLIHRVFGVLPQFKFGDFFVAFFLEIRVCAKEKNCSELSKGS